MNCLVTGGSRGIGLGIAKRLAAAGFGVTLVARNADLLAAEARGLPQVRDGQIHDSWVLNMADVAAVADLQGLPRPLAEYSTFVNCAGIAGTGLLATQPIGAIERTLNTNLQSPMILAKHFVRAMLRLKSKDAAAARKNLIFMSSVLATRGVAGSSTYSASKAGIEGFARSLAREVGSKNIAVNCVAPGLVDTDMAVGADPRLMQNNVFPGLVHPEAVVDAVMYLLESKALTGQTLRVDNGSSI